MLFSYFRMSSMYHETQEALDLALSSILDFLPNDKAERLTECIKEMSSEAISHAIAEDAIEKAMKVH